MSVQLPPAAPTIAPPPWWIHYLVGVFAVGVGLALLVIRPQDSNEAYLLMGAGFSFLGIGSGSALAASASA